MREEEGISNTGSGLAPRLLKGRLEMQVAGEEWYRVRVAAEREGDAQVFSHASCCHSYYLLKLLGKQVPMTVIPLSEHFKTGPESLSCSSIAYGVRPECLRIGSIPYGYMHGLEATA